MFDFEIFHSILPSSVSCASVLTRVRDTNEEPGSLNAE